MILTNNETLLFVTIVIKIKLFSIYKFVGLVNPTYITF